MNKLTSIRKSYGFSQQDIADMLNIKQPSVSAWENGDAYPSIENLRALSKIYGCRIDDLFDSEEPESDYD